MLVGIFVTRESRQEHCCSTTTERQERRGLSSNEERSGQLWRDIGNRVVANTMVGDATYERTP